MTNKIYAFLIVLGFIFLAISETAWNRFIEYKDDMEQGTPWFRADLKLYKAESGIIAVEYGIYPKRWLRGNWTGWAEYKAPSGNWHKFCSGFGSDTYYPSRSGVVHMTVDYFTGSKQRCDHKGRIFRVCADWDMTDRKQRSRFFDPVCSPLFDPKK